MNQLEQLELYKRLVNSNPQNVAMPVVPVVVENTPKTGNQNSGRSKFLNLSITTVAAGAILILGGGGYTAGEATNEGPGVAGYAVTCDEFNPALIAAGLPLFQATSVSKMLSAAISQNPMLIRRITISGASTITQQQQKMTLKSTKRDATWLESSLQALDQFTPQLQQNQFQSGVVVYDWQNGCLVDAFTYLQINFDVNQSLKMTVEYTDIVDYTSPTSVLKYYKSSESTKQAKNGLI